MNARHAPGGRRALTARAPNDQVLSQADVIGGLRGLASLGVRSNDPQTQAVALALDAWLQGGDGPLEAALCLPARGGPSLTMAAWMMHRDGTIRALWERVPAFAELPANPAAKMIAHRWRRYDTTKFAREIQANATPIADPDCSFFLLQRAGHKPLSSNRIYKILKGGVAEKFHSDGI